MNVFKTTHFNWQICDCCSGSGNVDHPSFANGFTSAEWDEMGDDWDADGETNARDRYLSGAYDVMCQDCSGLGRVKVPNWHSMPRTERREYVAFLREQRDTAECEWQLSAESAAERRMGA